MGVGVGVGEGRHQEVRAQMPSKTQFRASRCFGFLWAVKVCGSGQTLTPCRTSGTPLQPLTSVRLGGKRQCRGRMLPECHGRPSQWDPSSQHCASRRSGSWNPFFSREFMCRTKEAIIPRAAVAAAQACSPGVTCCPHLSVCFLPLSVGTQRLDLCSLLTLPQPPSGFGSWPLLF